MLSRSPRLDSPIPPDLRLRIPAGPPSIHPGESVYRAGLPGVPAIMLGIRDAASSFREGLSGIRTIASGIRIIASGIRDAVSGIRDAAFSFPKGLSGFPGEMFFFR